ncbi:MAG: UDP-N-acetyl-D-glucosamine dehydrogenase, partial [Nitrospirae bacterium]
MSLLEKIMKRTATVGVVGLGYVGLPLAVLQARTGYRVVGIDEAAEKVERVNRGDNYISDVDVAELQQVVRAGWLSATQEFGALRECDVVLICVPTPLTRNKEPD